MFTLQRLPYLHDLLLQHSMRTWGADIVLIATLRLVKDCILQLTSEGCPALFWWKHF